MALRPPRGLPLHAVLRPAALVAPRLVLLPAAPLALLPLRALATEAGEMSALREAPLRPGGGSSGRAATPRRPTPPPPPRPPVDARIECTAILELATEHLSSLGWDVSRVDGRWFFDVLHELKGGAYHSPAARAPEFATLMKALRRSLASQPGSWRTHQLSATAAALVGFARGGLLPGQQGRLLRSPPVAGALDTLATEFGARLSGGGVSDPPPGPVQLTNMLWALARAGRGSHPLFASASAWLAAREAVDDVLAASAAGAVSNRGLASLRQGAERLASDCLDLGVAPPRLPGGSGGSDSATRPVSPLSVPDGRESRHVVLLLWSVSQALAQLPPPPSMGGGADADAAHTAVGADGVERSRRVLVAACRALLRRVLRHVADTSVSEAQPPMPGMMQPPPTAAYEPPLAPAEVSALATALSAIQASLPPAATVVSAAHTEERRRFVQRFPSAAPPSPAALWAAVSDALDGVVNATESAVATTGTSLSSKRGASWVDDEDALPLLPGPGDAGAAGSRWYSADEVLAQSQAERTHAATTPAGGSTSASSKPPPATPQPLLSQASLARASLATLVGASWAAVAGLSSRLSQRLSPPQTATVAGALAAAAARYACHGAPPSATTATGVTSAPFPLAPTLLPLVRRAVVLIKDRGRGTDRATGVAYASRFKPGEAAQLMAAAVAAKRVLAAEAAHGAFATGTTTIAGLRWTFEDGVPLPGALGIVLPAAGVSAPATARAQSAPPPAAARSNAGGKRSSAGKAQQVAAPASTSPDGVDDASPQALLAECGVLLSLVGEVAAANVATHLRPSTAAALVTGCASLAGTTGDAGAASPTHGGHHGSRRYAPGGSHAAPSDALMPGLPRGQLATLLSLLGRALADGSAGSDTRHHAAGGAAAAAGDDDSDDDGGGSDVGSGGGHAVTEVDRTIAALWAVAAAGGPPTSASTAAGASAAPATSPALSRERQALLDKLHRQTAGAAGSSGGGGSSPAALAAADVLLGGSDVHARSHSRGHAAAGHAPPVEAAGAALVRLVSGAGSVLPTASLAQLAALAACAAALPLPPAAAVDVVAALSAAIADRLAPAAPTPSAAAAATTLAWALPYAAARAGVLRRAPAGSGNSVGTPPAQLLPALRALQQRVAAPTGAVAASSAGALPGAVLAATIRALTPADTTASALPLHFAAATRLRSVAAAHAEWTAAVGAAASRT